MTADPASARRDIVLVTIDDSSIRRLEPLVGPLAVAAHGPLATSSTSSRARPAKVIVYDVLFTERQRRTFEIGGDTWTGEESDRALAASAARAGNVVFAADVTADETGATRHARRSSGCGRASRSRPTRRSRRGPASSCRSTN